MGTSVPDLISVTRPLPAKEGWRRVITQTSWQMKGGKRTLRIRQDPHPAQRVSGRERELAAALAARRLAPPRPMGRPRLEKHALSFVFNE